MKKIRDHYFEKAKKENFAARSAYKLKEIDERQKIFKNGFKVVDLGCFPGGWTQYASQRVGDDGLVVGVDLTKIKIGFPANARFIHGDINELEQNDFLKDFSGKFNVILSDMAPKTSGIRHLDAARSLKLGEIALEVTRNWLRTKGRFLVKVFQGSELSNYVEQLKNEFRSVKIIKPKSSRNESVEVFVLGTGKI